MCFYCLEVCMCVFCAVSRAICTSQAHPLWDQWSLSQNPHVQRWVSCSPSLGCQKQPCHFFKKKRRPWKKIPAKCTKVFVLWFPLFSILSFIYFLFFHEKLISSFCLMGCATVSYAKTRCYKNSTLVSSIKHGSLTASEPFTHRKMPKLALWATTGKTKGKTPRSIYLFIHRSNRFVGDICVVRTWHTAAHGHTPATCFSKPVWSPRLPLLHK